MLLSETDKESAAADRTGRRFNLLATQLGILATVLAAVATLTAIPDAASKWVTAITAFLAALITGITTTLKPQDKARELQARAVEWRELHNRVRQFVRQFQQGQIGSGYGTFDATWEVERQLARLEFVRDNLLRRAAGLQPLIEPPAVVGETRPARPAQASS